MNPTTVVLALMILGSSVSAHDSTVVKCDFDGYAYATALLAWEEQAHVLTASPSPVQFIRCDTIPVPHTDDSLQIYTYKGLRGSYIEDSTGQKWLVSVANCFTLSDLASYIKIEHDTVWYFYGEWPRTHHGGYCGNPYISDIIEITCDTFLDWNKIIDAQSGHKEK